VTDVEDEALAEEEEGNETPATGNIPDDKSSSLVKDERTAEEVMESEPRASR
jgi:hypothetical protein